MKLNPKTILYIGLHNIGRKSFSTSLQRSATASVNGISINYETCGTKDGKVALFLPGSLGSIHTDFGPQLKELGKKNIHGIFWDPPGYGHSRPPNRDFSGNFFREDSNMAASLMKVLGYDKFSLAGWSDGGITALQMALDHSDKIEKIVVWGANGFVDEKDIKLYAKVKNVSDWSARMRKPMEDLYGPDYFASTWRLWVEAMERIYHEKGGALFDRDLGVISPPTLIVHGRKDPMVGEAHAQFLRDTIPNSRLIVWEDGKHNLHLRYAQEFNDLLSKFLNE